MVVLLLEYSKLAPYVLVHARSWPTLLVLLAPRCKAFLKACLFIHGPGQPFLFCTRPDARHF